MKKILYISYVLPSVTTTFVYREIKALEKAGYIIKTLSMSSPKPNEIHHEAKEVVDATHYLDRIGMLRIILNFLRVFLVKPKIWFSSIIIILTEKEVQGTKDRIRLMWHFMQAGYLFFYFKQEKIDQIHATFLNGPASLAFFLSRYLSIPFSFTIHASNIFLDPIMLKRKIADAKEIVTISQYNKCYLVQKYGNSIENKIRIIHCGIDVNRFQAKKRVVDQHIKIISVGQLTERKGFKYLLEACKILKDRGKQFYCCIVGEGEERISLEMQISKLEIGDCVTLLGSKLQHELFDMLQKASIFCLPSIISESGGREGIPVAIMEAMAMELPVVSTDTAGIPELVETGKEGILIQQKNPNAIANALQRLLENEKERIAMGTAARKKICREFNLNATAEEFFPVFN